MLINRPSDILSSEITSESVYRNRRSLVGAAIAAGALSGVAATGLFSPRAHAAARFPGLVKTAFSVDEPLTSLKDISTYNNYYEFGTDKEDPSENAHTLKTRPWTVTVEGEVKKPRVFDIEELLKLSPLEERVYRMRCLEGWSMVIPYVGYPLSDLIKRVEPTNKAKYVEFISLADPAQMPAIRLPILSWPYLEGLRMDEAMHPLTILTVGIYGEPLLNQNGAPLRVVTPWKYAFKNAKAIVKIRFVEEQPVTAWMKAGPREYGFYSNVNPDVDHPRWSQAKERRIGEVGKRTTLMFNGYGDQVAKLYAGMDLKKNF
jgi:methionine sulfoxide reductase catalytic subunit